MFRIRVWYLFNIYLLINLIVHISTTAGAAWLSLLGTDTVFQAEYIKYKIPVLL